MKNSAGWVILGICVILGSLCGRACGQMSGQRYSSVSTPYSQTINTVQHSTHTDSLTQEIQRLKKNNELFRLLIEKDPSFEKRLRKDLETLLKDPAFVARFQKNPVLTVGALEGSMPSLIDEMAKFLYKAPDEEFYNSFYTEYQHIKKNNCLIYPLPLADRQETAKVKSQAVLAALKTSYNFTPISEEQFTRLFKKMIQKYQAKGYNVSHLAIHWGMKPGKLTPYEACQVMKGTYEAMFSLPKKEMILLWRMVLYMGQEGN